MKTSRLVGLLFVFALIGASCGGDSGGSTNDPDPGTGDVDVQVDSDGDVTLDLGDDDDAGGAYSEMACEIIEPDELVALVPELEGLEINDGISFGPGTCSLEIKSRSTIYAVTIFEANGMSAMEWLEQEVTVDEFRELREMPMGAAVYETAYDGINLAVIEAGDALVSIHQGGVNLIPVDAWETVLSEYIVQRVEALR